MPPSGKYQALSGFPFNFSALLRRQFPQCYIPTKRSCEAELEFKLKFVDLEQFYRDFTEVVTLVYECPVEGQHELPTYQ